MASKWKILQIGIRQYRGYKHFLRLTEKERNLSSIPQKTVADILSLGPAFIKLGQIFSTRPDILPVQYIAALERLQERVPPFDVMAARQIIEKELGKPLQELFLSFEEIPAASASLSQVHFAVLFSGEKVALKIQRPEIKQAMLKNLSNLEDILHYFNFFFPKKVRRVNLIKGFEEFKRYTINELDFAHEGETIERFRKNFEGWDDVLFPKIYWEHSTEKLLTMEMVSGLRIQEITKILTKGEKDKLTTRLAEMELKMFISDGLFHADLHPGNIFFTEDDKIILLDFGMYGELSEEERNRFVLYWLAVVQNDLKRAFYHFKKQCTELSNANEEAFYEVFRLLGNEFYNKRLQDVSITKVYLSMISAGYKYGYVFPENLLLHAKALTTAEALTFELAPDARFEEITGPIISREFARIAINSKQINARIMQTFPEFLLTGELVSASTLDFDRVADETSLMWDTIIGQIIMNLKNWQTNSGIFQSILNQPALDILGKDSGEPFAHQTLIATWREYKRLEPDLPGQQSLGATFTLHLACASIALYNVLLEGGKTSDEAKELVYRIGWKIYTRMGELPMLIAGIFSDSPHKKMELATKVFRIFPFSPPDYGWEDIEADKDTIGFNCTRCHVAEYFKKFDLDEVCYNTWCKLDFPLAEQWGGKLSRTSSIANGAKICDFRWQVNIKATQG